MSESSASTFVREDPVVARRLARFKAQLARARKAVAADPPLTEDERAEIARIWLGQDSGAPS